MVGELDLESFMYTSTDSAFESVENFWIGDGNKHVSQFEVDMEKIQNSGKSTSSPYPPDVEDISQDDKQVKINVIKFKNI